MKKPAKATPQIWVIDLETPGVHRGSATATGPFASLADAERHLISDAIDTYLDSDKSLRDFEEATGQPWASPVLIVEVKRCVRQVPRAQVTCTLEDVETP